VTDDDAKRAIFARRARFIAAAMMGTGLMSCDRKTADHTVCLSVAIPEPPDAAPLPCLSPPPIPPDAGATIDVDAGEPAPADTGAADAGAKDAGAKPVPVPCLSHRPPPRPCLSRAPDPKPRPCLDYNF
jgi:hypothetical protein